MYIQPLKNIQNIKDKYEASKHNLFKQKDMESLVKSHNQTIVVSCFSFFVVKTKTALQFRPCRCVLLSTCISSTREALR